MVEKLSIEEAVEALNDEDASNRKLAIKSLERVNDERIVEPLIEATKDDNAQVRFGAAEILGDIGDSAVDKLIEEFNKESGSNKRFLTVALQKTGSEKAIDSFAEALSDEDFGVRKVAVRALGELRAKDKIDAIAECINDEDGGVRTAAIFALGDIASEESIKIIKDARRREKDKDFKKYCNKAIKKAEKIIKSGGKIKISKGQPMSTIKEMEKTDIEAAIKAYEVHVKEGSTSDAPYKRLATLYRKTNDYDNEVRILKIAIETLSKEKPEKEAWFKKRLDKMI
ncbi:HEAT repeat domain-containing protein [Methanobrevibacter olleyae]|uniref:HEAT repeat-containing protein n=1 Tax=Methanobrevibacter olleyae TaxID=294671 RepID=A0A126QYE4_METOL|nr:HEAT repeat domain-containing protein [Methanobrevibacter olleyae]AMK14822.1 HEAT repeat-containing protein [Methanobrevibacter olleyae]